MVLMTYIIILAVVSLVTFCFYAVDKHKAINGEWRTPEKVLLGLSFFGGAVGGLLGMYLCRHKTKKWYFKAINIAGLIWQIAVGVLIAFG